MSYKKQELIENVVITLVILIPVLYYLFSVLPRHREEKVKYLKDGGSFLCVNKKSKENEVITLKNIKIIDNEYRLLTDKGILWDLSNCSKSKLK